jgi:HEPN domain-containing protein
MRWKDWLAQAKRDLDHARHAAGGGHHEWACFASQQAAEKAVKAVFQKMNREAWGHSVTGLVERLRETAAVPDEVLDAARQLDKHYIPARYPNGFESGIPADYYTAQDSARAIEDAEKIIRCCEGLLD